MSEAKKEPTPKSLTLVTFNAMDGSKTVDISGWISTNKEGEPITTTNRDGEKMHLMNGRIKVEDVSQRVNFWVNTEKGLITMKALGEGDERYNEIKDVPPIGYINFRGLAKNDEVFANVSIAFDVAKNSFNLGEKPTPVTFQGREGSTPSAAFFIKGHGVESTLNGPIGEIVEKIKADPNVFRNDRTNNGPDNEAPKQKSSAPAQQEPAPNTNDELDGLDI